MKILQFPLTRLVLFFIVGIVFANYVAVDFQIILYFSISIFVLILVRFFLNRKKNIRSIFDGFLYFTLFFFIGIWTSWMHNPDTNSKTFTKQISEISEPQKLEVILREKLKNSKQNQRFVAIVEQTNNLKSSGKIILNIDSENLKFPLKVGQKLRFDSKIYLPKKPANPDQFDYGRYLKNKGILAQTFVEPNQLQISTITTKDIWYYSAVIKNRIKNNLEKSGFAKNELSVILALFMGDRDSISAEIKTDYQLSGAMHILAVSGLHVGILMIFIGFFLDFLPHSKYKPFIKLVVILLVLWSFAFLAGLSASVVRAVTMFSFVAIGNAMQKRTAIFHTLLVSMFLILLFQPTFLFDVGFQLSYCALFFILWLQPLFASIWKPRNKIVTYFWDIFTVSFAAQIGVFPLSLYYFHQFPGLFFITNLFVIPLVFAIMVLVFLFGLHLVLFLYLSAKF